MKTRKTLFIIIAVVALSLVAFVGSAFAQDATPTDEPTDGGWLPQMQQRMEERFGAGAWGEMIARMTQMHGADFTAERLQWMDENGCPMLEDGEWTGPMMRGGPMWNDDDATGSAAQSWGRGMMNRFQSDDDAEFVPGQGMMGGQSRMGGRGMMHDDDMSQQHMGGRGMWGSGQ